MPVHAGFAYAIQVRKKVLNDSLLLAYHAGKIRTLASALISGPPNVVLDFTLERPQVTFDPARTDAFVLTLTGAGGLTVQFAQLPETREVRFEMVALIKPRFAVAPGELTFSPDRDDIALSSFTFSVIEGAPFSSAAATYLASPVFRERLEANVALGLSLGVLEIPPIKIGQLGSLLNLSNTTSRARVLDDSILIGLSLASPQLSLIGELQELVSFAGSHDIAVVLNPAVLPVVLSGLLAPVQQRVRDAGANLDSLSVTAGTGKLLVAGTASKSGIGSVSFSLNATLALFASRAGKHFQYLHRPVSVNTRVWPAITFHAENIQVDVHPATWVRIVEVASVALTGAVVPLYIESLLSGAAHQVTFGVKEGFVPPTIARVQRLAPQRAGDPHVKLRINDFSIAPAAIFAGLSVTPQLPDPMLMGLTSIPSNYLSRPIRYRMVLPIGVLEDDPYLRIRWQVQNLNSGVVVLDEDGVANGRLVREVRVSDFGGANVVLGISAEVYRRVGTQDTAVFNDGIQLAVSPPLLPGMLRRWRYGVKNPQVKYSEEEAAWSYVGEATIARWSALHRLDRPCLMANKRSRYVYVDEVLDDLPFPLTQVDDRREYLCTYCFFGGPGAKRPFL